MAGQSPEAHRIRVEDTQRRQSSLEKSLQKIASQRDESTRRVKLGLGILVLGAFLLVTMLGRLFLANGSWAELGISILAILGLIPLGLFLVISSSMIIRLLGKQEQELRKENVGR
jgi:magnesium-transporting ATPase (P-type)